jgi:hypothetical protein
LFLCCFFFVVVALEFELRASCLLWKALSPLELLPQLALILFLR